MVRVCEESWVWGVVNGYWLWDRVMGQDYGIGLWDRGMG